MQCKLHVWGTMVVSSLQLNAQDIVRHNVCQKTMPCSLCTVLLSSSCNWWLNHCLKYQLSNLVVTVVKAAQKKFAVRV